MNMEINSVPKATLGRLPRYLEFLDRLTDNSSPYISATTIAKHLALGEVQVRKDLRLICGSGRPKVGYITGELKACIEEHLGKNRMTSAVLVGAGKLGRALLEYEEFEKYGVRIAAAFDSDANATAYHGSVEVLPMSSLEEFCKSKNIQIGIITVSENSAQTVCNKMISCGISAIWNFAPHKLEVPEGVLVRQENLALSLAYLNNQLCNQF